MWTEHQHVRLCGQNISILGCVRDTVCRTSRSWLLVGACTVGAVFQIFCLFVRLILITAPCSPSQPWEDGQRGSPLKAQSIHRLTWLSLRSMKTHAINWLWRDGSVWYFLVIVIPTSHATEARQNQLLFCRGFGTEAQSPEIKHKYPAVACSKTSKTQPPITHYEQYFIPSYKMSSLIFQVF